MSFKKSYKGKSKQSNPGEKTALDTFLEIRKKAIIESLSDLSEDKPVWQAPVFNTKYLNPVSNSRYNIMNSSLLLNQMKNRMEKDDTQELLPFFMTFNQAKSNGVSVKRGSSSFIIIKQFGKKIEPKDNEPDKANASTEEGKDRYISLRSLDHVFNLSDIEGELPERIRRNMAIGFKSPSSEESKTLLTAITEASPVPVRRMTDFSSSSSSYYSPSAEYINLPPSSLFRNVLEEISTLSHEIAHAWGHESRFNRDTLRAYSKSNLARAEEELVANVASQAIIQHFGIELSEQDQFATYQGSHDAYDFGWAKLLKENPDSIIKAVEAADKTANKIIYETEQRLAVMLKENPDLSVSPFIKERITSKEAAAPVQEKDTKPVMKF